MSTQIKKHKTTSIILLLMTIGAFLYIANLQGWIQLGKPSDVVLEEQADIINLDIKEKSYIGVNNKQIYKVTADGITTYDFTGEEIWKNTFTMPGLVVRQRSPYIAIGSELGKSIIIFNQKGGRVDINTENPIIYFSINREGSVVTIEEQEQSHIVTVYDNKGIRICSRTSYISESGYPMVAELSPNSDLMLISYLNVNNPQVQSNIFAVKTKETKAEKIDNTAYGITQMGNLVYAIEFMNDNTWISIGDRKSIWYDLTGNEKGSRSDLFSIFVPYIEQISPYGNGFFSLVVSPKQAQNIIHRQDQLLYFNDKGEETFKLELNEGASSFLQDENGVVVKVEEYYKGYDRLGNPIFEYKPKVDVTKVIYCQDINKGIAVNKEKVILLTPKREGK